MEQMNTENFEGKGGMDTWSDTKSKIKTKWPKFTDGDIESFRKGLGQIQVRLQSVYGLTKEDAEREFKEFQQSMTLNGATGQNQPDASSSSQDKTDRPSNPMPGLETKLKEDESKKTESTKSQTA